MIEESISARKNCESQQVAAEWVERLSYALKFCDPAERSSILREIMSWTHFASRLLFGDLKF